ncbi:MAG: hypothetical protein M3Y07_16260 [Acidobacteriota bacterium]|nr:hypothetical protein [Acidobacteriota bacterium]
MKPATHWRGAIAAAKCLQFKVHPIQIAKWRKSALERLPELFVDGRARQTNTGQAETDALFEQIGRQKIELDRLKKSWNARLRNFVGWWIGTTRKSAFAGNANCWE